MPESIAAPNCVKPIRLLWRLYLFTFRLGLAQCVKGLEFYRCIEYYWFLKYFGSALGTKRVMDVGPWKSPLPSFLALCGAHVRIIDVREGAVVQESYAKRTKAPSFKIHIMPYFEGMVRFDLPASAFDVVTCISTIEHFQDSGDCEVIDEIYRILVDGGKAFLTVPYGSHYSEHRHYKWFERTYDASAIEDRLCRHGFKVSERLYFKDNRTLRFTRLYWRIPKLLRALLGRLWILPAIWYIKHDQATVDNASLCGLVLEKE